VFLADVRDARAEPLAEFVHVVVDVVVGRVPERLVAGSHRHRVPGERARLEHLAGGGERLDHLGAAADRADGEPAADDLPEGGDVGDDAEFPLCTPEPPDPEAGDHLVEDEQRPGCVTQLPEPPVVAVDRGDDPRVAEDRLDEHRRDVVAVLLEDALGGGGVVERDREGVFRERRRHAGRRRAGVVRVAFHQRRFLCAVVAALHDDDLVPARVSPREPDRRDRRLGPAVDEPDRLDARDVVGDELGVSHLDPRGGAVHRASLQVALDGLPDGLGEVVAVQERPVPHHVVDQPVAVGVDDVGTLAALDEERVRHRRPDGGVDPPGHDRQRAIVQLPRAVVVHALRFEWSGNEAVGFRRGATPGTAVGRPRPRRRRPVSTTQRLELTLL